jgi:hypothetical protein
MSDLIDRVKGALEGATPGPWVHNKFRINRPGYEGKYQGRIADACYWSEGHTGAKCNPLREHAEANARLIALAPDMARALIAMEAGRKAAEGLKDVAEELAGRSTLSGDHGELDYIICDAREALAAYRKATEDSK